MGSRRLSLRPTVLLLFLSVFSIYLLHPSSYSKNISPESNGLKLQLGHDSDEFTPTRPSAKDSQDGHVHDLEVDRHRDEAPITYSPSTSPTASATALPSCSPPPIINSAKISKDPVCQCLSRLTDDEDDKEYFPDFLPNAPENEYIWHNVPSREDYRAQLTPEELKFLDNFLPLSSSRIEEWDEDTLGDGYGGGETAKWMSRREKFNRLYSLRTEKEWRDWIKDLNGDGMPPLTKFAQEYIYRWQNPPGGCKGKRFLIMNAFPSDKNFGLGALVQAVASSLSLAIRTDRILVYNITNAPGHHFFSPNPSNPSCGQSFDCIFLPLSKCSIPNPKSFPTETDSDDPILLQWPLTQPVSEKYFREHPWSLPPLLVEAFRRYNNNKPHQGTKGEIWEGMSFDAVRYWWRTQAAAYIMRLNKPAMEHLRDMRLNKFSYSRNPQTGKQTPLNQGWSCPSQDPSECELKPMPFPMEPGGFSMHIRHGDKGIEMKLVDLPLYVSAAATFIKRNPLGFTYTTFISTEDPDVLDQAKNLSLAPKIPATASDEWKMSPKWKWYWSDIPRLNVSPEEQLQKLAGGNRTEMTLGWMLQLMMALEADGWIGTRGSGWNRLIDQLRCVWVAGCRKPFLEVGTPGSWKYYGP